MEVATPLTGITSHTCPHLAHTWEQCPSLWLRPTVCLVIGASLLRLPFIWHGFGVHPDEWGVLRSGIEMWLDGRFYISRPPGYPLNEIMVGGLALLGGGPLCALATAIASVVTVVVFERWLRVCGVRHSAWIAAALAVHPWFWRSSTNVLDYVWAMLMLVFAGYAAQTGRYRRAALCCALALGFRWSSIIWCAVLALWAWHKHRRLRETAVFVAIVAVVGTVVLWPALWGTRLWAGEGGQYTFLRPSLRRTVLFGYHLLEFWGHLLGAAAIAGAWWIGRRRLRTCQTRRPDWFLPHLAIVAIYVPFFWLHSDKCEYLLPALPSALFLLGRTVPRRGWQVIALAFLLNSMVTLRLGHWPRTGIQLFAMPSLEVGPVLMDDNLRQSDAKLVTTAWEALQRPDAVVPVQDFRVLDALYVSARLTRGPASQLMLSGSLVPVIVHRPTSGQMPRVDVWPTRRTGDWRTRWPALLRPESGAVAVDRLCTIPAEQIGPAVRTAFRKHVSAEGHE